MCFFLLEIFAEYKVDPVPGIKMQNYFQKTEEPLLRRPLCDLDNLPSTSKAAISASSASSISSFESCQLAEDPLKLSGSLILEEPELSDCSKPKGSASKRLVSLKVDPDYNPRAKLATAPRGMLTRSQLKRDQSMLLHGTPAEMAPKDQKPNPQPVVSLRRFRTGQKMMPTVWHSGNVCHHALRQICNPETRQTAGNDVERWRAIESICLDLRGINVRGDVGVLKGQVSFEDVFEVLGLDEQGEPQVNPTPPLKVDSPEQDIEVASTDGIFDIEKYLMPPLTPIQSEIPIREQDLQRESKGVAKSPRRGKKRTAKSTYRRR